MLQKRKYSPPDLNFRPERSITLRFSKASVSWAANDSIFIVYTQFLRGTLLHFDRKGQMQKAHTVKGDSQVNSLSESDTTSNDVALSSASALVNCAFVGGESMHPNR